MLKISRNGSPFSNNQKIRCIQFDSNSDVVISSAETNQDIQLIVEKILTGKATKLPSSKEAMILLKPNLNNDLIGLTGATTDLRIIAAVLRFLRNRGYANVVIGDGPNVGMYHSQINVFSRLMVDKLAKKFGYTVCDFNHAPSRDIDLLGRKAKVAEICFKCDFFINLPKIKTHMEAKFSCCLKNLVGCLVGYDKRKLHLGLFERKYVMYERLLKLNEILQPDFHIVDGLVAMEGNGPSSGTPKKLNVILAGADPLLVDLMGAKIAGFDFREIPYLSVAVKRGMVTPKLSRKIASMDYDGSYGLRKPEKNFLVDVFLRNFFVMLRLKRFDWFFSLDIVSKVLIILKIRQEEFKNENSSISKIYIDRNRCTDCGKCLDYCPLNLPISSRFDFDGCIECLYCYLMCPQNAIETHGKLGFLSPQIARYRSYFAEDERLHGKS